MEKVLVTCIVLALALLLIITLLLSKKSNKNNKAEEKIQVQINEQNLDQQKISIQEKQPVDTIQEKKPKRYCYMVEGQLQWKARKSKKPEEKLLNTDLLDPDKMAKKMGFYD